VCYVDGTNFISTIHKLDGWERRPECCQGSPDAADQSIIACLLKAAVAEDEAMLQGHMDLSFRRKTLDGVPVSGLRGSQRCQPRERDHYASEGLHAFHERMLPIALDEPVAGCNTFSSVTGNDSQIALMALAIFTMAATLRSTSSSEVDQLETEIRMAV